MTPVTILHEAEVEIWDAVAYYDEKAPELGLDFLSEIESTLETIREAPNRWPIHSHGTRRFLTRRFPYLVVFLVHSDHIWIISFAHCKRRPDYWKNRVETTEQTNHPVK
jgi:toxin ParE1/3/4